MKRPLCAATCLAMLLATCGGGQDGILDPAVPGRDSSPSPSQPSSDPKATAAQRLVGGSPPVETAAAQDRRSREVFRRADSLIITTLYVDFNDADIRDDSIAMRCSGSICTGTYPSGETLTQDLSSGSFEIGNTLLTRNGITIELLTEDDSETIGSTLHNSEFDSSYVRYDDVNFPYSGRGSAAFGDLTGTAPLVSGTWRGMMTAVTTENNDLLLGDAVLQYSASESGGSLSAEFSNIVNFSRNRAHAQRSNVVFPNVPVRSDGTFNRSSSSFSNIQGAFYGNAHAEAVGVFEHSELLGAFGTKRVR